MMILLGAFILFFSILTIESICLVLWLKWYFFRGIEVFRKTIILSNEVAYPFNLEYLQLLVSKKGYPPLDFQDIDRNKYAFRIGDTNHLRADFFSFPMIRGTFTVKPDQREVTFVGYVNYSRMSFAFLFFLFSIVYILANGWIIGLVGVVFAFFEGLSCYDTLKWQVNFLDRAFTRLSVMDHPGVEP